ncbi:MAG TPA: hypothetical protein V6C81_24745 [Planktothrix sp.]
MYINIHSSLSGAHPHDDIDQIEHTLGFDPAIVVTATVSGRHPGDREVRSFVLAILQRFDGVARDDYSDHCWTSAEIASDALAFGHPFFDYSGW